MTTHTFVEHRGCRIAYDVCGEGPPVMLLQGVGVHGGGWRPQVEGLSHKYRCLSFDNRGMSRSQPMGVAALTVEQMAEDVEALMDSQGWHSAHLVGHSLGGLVAQHVALKSRQRVRSLSLLCTFPRGRDATGFSARMLWLGIRSRVGPRRFRRNAFLEIVMPPSSLRGTDREALADSLAPLFGHDLAVQPDIVMKQLAAMRDYDAMPRLRELSGLPTLVVSAEHDPIARPAVGRVIADGIPGAAYVEIADASHGVPIQCPDRINGLLLEHLTQAEAHRRRVADA